MPLCYLLPCYRHKKCPCSLITIFMLPGPLTILVLAPLCLKGHSPCSLITPKGTTINDLGGGNFRNELIFSREPYPYKFFFLGKASQNLFFPGECLSKFIFSWRVDYLPKLFFSRFPPAPRPHPKIINGRPLTGIDQLLFAANMIKWHNVRHLVSLMETTFGIIMSIMGVWGTSPRNFLKFWSKRCDFRALCGQICQVPNWLS